MSENFERTVTPAGPPGNVPAQRTARQRRPTGAPPPLPHPFRVTTTAEYEDYALRLLRDAGIRTARPYGIVEITPEREYMVVTEFFDGAVEIGHLDVGDEVIDQGLRLVRRLWDAGIAHRDIKPGNLMVRDEELLLIDAGFAQVRPSPWRQAVDLGNMMLVLAVRSDPDRVYQRALRYFSPAELSEAFAATRGVASPTQLRAFMKPCVSALPSGWQVGGADIASGRSVFWLDSDQAGLRAVTITLSAACDVSGIQPEPSDKPGTLRFDGPPTVGPRFTGLRMYTFPGGCASYRFDFDPGASPLLATAVDGGVGLMPRAALVRYVRDQEGLALCGRGASCPG
jgi:hypothetical protein